MLKIPEHLKKPGREMYEQIGSEYGIDDAGGLQLLTVAAECLDRMRNAQAEIEKNGAVLTDRYGGLKAHPSIAIEKDSRIGLMAALKQLNLDLEPLRDRRGNPGLDIGLRSIK